MEDTYYQSRLGNGGCSLMRPKFRPPVPRQAHPPPCLTQQRRSLPTDGPQDLAARALLDMVRVPIPHQTRIRDLILFFLL